MLILAVAALFVIGGLYIRRQYGGGALAGLWAATTLVMAATSSAGFLLLLTRFGTTPVPAAGRALAFGLVVAAIVLGLAGMAK